VYALSPNSRNRQDGTGPLIIDSGIPRVLHIIWVGNQAIRPDNCIRTWIDLNPSWKVRIWKNEDAANYGWHNSHHMTAMARREMNGVADMMRWEILHREGGFVVDADSICVKPLADWLFQCELFSCWENELVRPGLIAAGYVASVPGCPLIGQIVQDIKNAPTVMNAAAWETVGPQRLTESYRKYAYANMTIYPSHFFIPEHYSGARYAGPGHIFARQEWASTKQSYGELHKRKVG